jgi:hypothetical protein
MRIRIHVLREITPMILFAESFFFDDESDNKVAMLIEGTLPQVRQGETSNWSGASDQD